MFKKLIRKLIRYSGYSEYEAEPMDEVASWKGNSTSIVTNHRTIEGSENGTHFTIYNASGGKIIQVWYYDTIKSENKSRLYLIHSDANLSEELSMIMTKESLSR